MRQVRPGTGTVRGFLDPRLGAGVRAPTGAFRGVANSGTTGVSVALIAFAGATDMGAAVEHPGCVGKSDGWCESEQRDCEERAEPEGF
jgi:hypothetical protein